MVNTQKLFAICGVICPILYTIVIMIGGILRPGYSHISQAISILFEVGAPNKPMLDIMLIITNLMLIILSFGLHQGINHGNGSKLGPLMLIFAGILGLVLIIFFPLNPQENKATFAGEMHVIIAFSMAFLTIFAILAFWHRLKDDVRWSGYVSYSYGTFIAAFIIAIITGVLMTNPFIGLIERISIGMILQWIETMAIKLLRLSIKQKMI